MEMNVTDIGGFVEKYKERLKTIKEKRAATADINSDVENAWFDDLIQSMAEVVSDAK